MKYSMAVVIATAVMTLVTGCSDGSEELGLSVRFTLEETTYEWTYGVDRSGENVFGINEPIASLFGEGNDPKKLIVIAARDPILDPMTVWDNAIVLTLPGASPFKDGESREPTTIVMGGETVWECDYGATVSLFRVDQVGGIVEGSFSGVDPSLGTRVTDGSFRVRRVIDQIVGF